jgi:hypothetical protein
MVAGPSVAGSVGSWAKGRRCSAVPVVGACEASSAIGAAAGPRKLGQPVGEIAEGSTAQHRDQTEGGDRDTRAGVKAVEQQDQRDHGR